MNDKHGGGAVKNQKWLHLQGIAGRMGLCVVWH